MKKFAFLFVAVFALAFASGCAKKATPDECKQSCAKMAELNAAAAPAVEAEDPAATVTAEFAVKVDELQKKLAEEIQAIQTECDTAIAALATDEEKATATEGCNVKKNEKAQSYAPQFEALSKDKDAALTAAADVKAQAEASAKAKAEKDLADCADKCVKGRTAKTKTDCQMKAGTVEAFNACK